MNFIKPLLLTALSLISWKSVNAQTTICLGDDITVCAGTPLTINNCTGNPQNLQGLVLDNPTQLTMSDDVWSGVINMGFNFNYYGTTYNQCVIGSNAIITFDLSEAGGYCSWNLSGAGTMPNPGFDDALNSVMPAYQDINPNAGTSPNGQVLYQTIGSAPNRMFVVLYKDINFFSCTTVCNYIATIFYETSNNIEVHIGDKPLCTSWNGGLAIQGVQNAPGTAAVITPGRNNTQWAANQEGKLWTPTSPSNTSNYTISNVPYKLVTSAGTTFQWENTNGQTFPYNNGVLNIPSVQSGTVGYFLSGSACGASLGQVSDISYVTGVSSSVSASGTDDICSAGLGTVTATPTGGSAPFTFNWTTLGNATTATVNNVTAGVHTVQMTDSMGCTSSSWVVVGDTPASFQGSSTVVSCPGGNDGTAFAEMIPVLGNVTYQWDDPNNQTTQTATGLTAGTYNCTITSDIGCQGVVTVDVTEIPGMTGSIVNQSDVTCNSGNDGMIEVSISQGTAPYSYAWDNSTSTNPIANDLYVGNHTVTVTDDNGCIITISGVLNEPPALDINSITPDTQICPEDDITLNVSGTGGSSAYTFTWSQNGTVIGTGTSITVDPDVTNTQYCVELSEACGSPVDNECVLIYFPTPIPPAASPDEYSKCVPGFFEFTNNSANGGEIATTLWDFGSNKYLTLENGNDSISMWFEEVGNYDLIMTNTSIYGCVYTDTLTDFIEVLPSPTADFIFSSNPTTFFETIITLQDKSSFDVVNWYWSSPFSNPTSSTSENPVVQFPEGEVAQYPVTLIVETEKGCMDTITKTLHVVEDVLFYAPNAFTPDGDEHNQSWRPYIDGIDIYDFELFIFNRWGEVIWESHDPEASWDGTYNGKPVPAGVYVWRAKVGSTLTDDKREFNGYINILR